MIDVQRKEPDISKMPIKRIVSQSGSGNFFVHVDRTDTYRLHRVRVTLKDDCGGPVDHASMYPEGMRDLADALVMMAAEMENE